MKRGAGMDIELMTPREVAFRIWDTVRADVDETTFGREG